MCMLFAPHSIEHKETSPEKKHTKKTKKKQCSLDTSFSFSGEKLNCKSHEIARFIFSKNYVDTDNFESQFKNQNGNNLYFSYHFL